MEFENRARRFFRDLLTSKLAEEEKPAQGCPLHHVRRGREGASRMWACQPWNRTSWPCVKRCGKKGKDKPAPIIGTMIQAGRRRWKTPQIGIWLPSGLRGGGRGKQRGGIKVRDWAKLERSSRTCIHVSRRGGTLSQRRSWTGTLRTTEEKERGRERGRTAEKIPSETRTWGKKSSSRYKKLN